MITGLSQSPPCHQVYKIVRDILEALADISRSIRLNLLEFSVEIIPFTDFIWFHLIEEKNMQQNATECYECSRIRPVITKDIADLSLQALRDVPKERPKVFFFSQKN